MGVGARGTVSRRVRRGEAAAPFLWVPTQGVTRAGRRTSSSLHLDLQLLARHSAQQCSVRRSPLSARPHLKLSSRHRSGNSPSARSFGRSPPRGSRASRTSSTSTRRSSRLARRWLSSGCVERGRAVGRIVAEYRSSLLQPAPYFKGVAAVDGAFEDVELSQYKGKWLIVLFYPMDFTFVCPTEILAFDRALPAFRALDTEVLAVSTDSEFSHRASAPHHCLPPHALKSSLIPSFLVAWANMPRAEGGLGPNLKLPLLADKTHKMSRDYGVLLEDKGIALRGLFVIDPKGITRQITINDLPVGRSVEETIRLVKAFQVRAWQKNTLEEHARADVLSSFSSLFLLSSLPSLKFTDEHGEVSKIQYRRADRQCPLTLPAFIASSRSARLT